MSKETSLSDQFTEELRCFLEEKIPSLLIEASNKYADSSPWEMPVIDDFVIAIAVQDFKDGDGTVLSFASKNSPAYRIRGLLHEILL